ncbi:MAG: helix-turn-helix domain-containing protein [Roseateles sp.]|uniref:helix-turn-helix domain-containing protein n=1 Tax=Roseateles sp. TaxID=1971397 RepID=UPI004035BD63
MDTPNTPIARACKHLGGQGAVARLLGLKPPTVNEWCTGKRKVPAERCIQIEQLTDGAVRCEELLPDFPWAAFRNQRIAAKPVKPARRVAAGQGA